MMKEPEINVGIVHALQLNFTLNGLFYIDNQTVHGQQSVSLQEGCIRWNGKYYQELTFTPLDKETSFSLQEVTIGINFHWERQETQTFLGTLRFIIHEGKITAINRIAAEQYLISVISSEMKATASLEFLKAHAVISRSWLFAQIEERKRIIQSEETHLKPPENEGEHIRWYDHEEHTVFDVCADDHCQRYQGITKASSPIVKEAVNATRGQVLMYNNTICDARFSKCCGGISEEFNYCWDDHSYPYLQAVRDLKNVTGNLPDLRHEKEAALWIQQAPDSFCNTHDKRILSQILNNYDQETTDFYRWKKRYTQEELSSLIKERSRRDFGSILQLIPVERGKSGRISKLKIIGTKQTCIVGKELEIRKFLSHTHLFSSAFVVTTGETVNSIPQWFELTGAGWGHGVGLCQIGAAVMGEQGYSYEAILLHYYQNAMIQALY